MFASRGQQGACVGVPNEKWVGHPSLQLERELVTVQWVGLAVLQDVCEGVPSEKKVGLHHHTFQLEPLVLLDVKRVEL